MMEATESGESVADDDGFFRKKKVECAAQNPIYGLVLFLGRAATTSTRIGREIDANHPLVVLLEEDDGDK